MLERPRAFPKLLFESDGLDNRHLLREKSNRLTKKSSQRNWWPVGIEKVHGRFGGREGGEQRRHLVSRYGHTNWKRMTAR